MTQPTYVVSGLEPLHPDPEVAMRFREYDLAPTSMCNHGCKIYADPRSDVKVLAHNRIYGCPL